jgi:hypothetical protein
MLNKYLGALCLHLKEVKHFACKVTPNLNNLAILCTMLNIGNLCKQVNECVYLKFQSFNVMCLPRDVLQGELLDGFAGAGRLARQRIHDVAGQINKLRTGGQ